MVNCWQLFLPFTKCNKWQLRVQYKVQKRKHKKCGVAFGGGGGNDSFSSLFKMNLIFWVLEKMFLFEWQTSGSHSKRQMSHDLDFQNSILKLEEMRSYLVNAFCL